MSIKILATHDEMSRVASEYIIGIIKRNPKGLYCFAGGDTPVETIKYIVAAHNEGVIDLTQAYFIELDEWVGLDKNDKGSCAYYLEKNITSHIQIDPSHVHCFETKEGNLEVACQLANNFILEHEGITLSLLGVGVNGHIGFNEPGTTLEMGTRVVNLDEVTQQVGQKYFEKTTSIANQGITLGLKELLASEYLVVVASGASKKNAIKQLFEKNISSKWPVTYVVMHPQYTVFLESTANPIL